MTPTQYGFTQQRSNAKQRGIKFKLTFEQWLAIWKQSRRLPQRGRTKGKYVMARFGDKGAYEVGNVRIILFATNNREASLGRPHTEATKEKVRQAKLGKPRPDLAERNRTAWMRQKVSESWNRRRK
jgi:hypothetical protein